MRDDATLPFTDARGSSTDGWLGTRELPGYRETPIIATTAKAFAEDKARCFEAGMNEFLIKPFNPDILFATLLRALNKRSG